MADLLDRASRLIQSEGFTGAHSFIFLTRYAALQDDKALLRLVGETLEELSTLPESATLAYAYAEYYEASRSGFCPAAAEFLLARASRNDPMLLSALAKSARVFGSAALLERAIDLAEEEQEEEREDPFTALGLLELYRATQHGDYLNRASDLAVRIRRNFQQKFDPSSVYDLEQPSANSAVALLYDALGRITQEEQWVKAREVQNRFIALLADRYPTKVAFGLCALLSDSFEAKTVVCVVPEGTVPPEVKALLSFYSPLTEILVVPGQTDRTKVYLLRQGKLEEIAGI